MFLKECKFLRSDSSSVGLLSKTVRTFPRTPAQSPDDTAPGPYSPTANPEFPRPTTNPGGGCPLPTGAFWTPATPRGFCTTSCPLWTVSPCAIVSIERQLPIPDAVRITGEVAGALSRLAGISGLKVIARQTAIQYKGSTKSARAIAEELDVEYVLEGTVRTDRAPNGSGQVRITPQLIRASDESHLWAEAVDGILSRRASAQDPLVLGQWSYRSYKSLQ